MKNAQPTNWERIAAVIKMSEKSVNGFARYIGLARGENLYQIKRGNNGISRDLADRICLAFPSVSKLWLLTGEGQMLTEKMTSVESSADAGSGCITPWIYFAGVALSALIGRGNPAAEDAAALYADRMVKLYEKQHNERQQQ